MTLYYAMGGGMGHLVRAQAFLHTFAIGEWRIITSSTYSDKIFDKSLVISVDTALESNPAGLLGFIREQLRKNNTSRLILDCFPGGILGEIRGADDVDDLPLWYVTRNIRWDRYLSKVSGAVTFEKSFILEELEPEHELFVKGHCTERWEGKLDYPIPVVPDRLMRLLSEGMNWLVVHSGRREEIELLIDHAYDMAEAEQVNPALFLISPVSIPNLQTIDHYPAHGFFPYVNRIITGCGFNIMEQTLPFREKHIFIPFERRYDDQFLRARKAKKTGFN